MERAIDETGALLEVNEEEEELERIKLEARVPGNCAWGFRAEECWLVVLVLAVDIDDECVSILLRFAELELSIPLPSRGMFW